jgi:signal transduction histidine kinase
MKTGRSIVVLGLLLLVPTVACGILMFRLLKHEQQRIAQVAASAAEAQAASVASDIALAVEELRNALVQGLVSLGPSERSGTLRAWERSNPLVRNVFQWHPESGFALPQPGQASSEEAAFQERFSSLFGGRVPWSRPVPDAASARVASRVDLVKSAELYSQAAPPSSGGRRERVSEPERSDTAAKADVEAEVESGWMPWFWEDQLSMLVWARAADGWYYGVEMETSFVLSRLVELLPQSVPAGSTLALLDGNGRVFCQRGPGMAEGAKPAATALVGTSLPHWQVAVYQEGEGRTIASGRLYGTLSALLVGIFIAAVGGGGLLLVWQSYRNLLDARRKTTFVSNVSHELKTPLTTIRMYAEMLGEGRVKDEERRRQYLDVMVQESQRLTRLINNVLDFSRMEQGRKTYRPEDVDLVSLVRHVLEHQAPRLEEAGVEVATEMPEATCMARVDRDAVEQVVLNLVDNAIKYAASGKRLEIALRDKGPGGWVVRFRDHGPGVPSNHRNRLFQQFHRVDDSLTARQPGCGLGLSISKRLMTDQGGDLVYEAPEGGGASFVLTVPGSGGDA